MKIYNFNPKVGHITEGSLEGLIQSLDSPAPPKPGESAIKRAFKKFGLAQMHMSHLVIDDRTVLLRGKADSAKARDQMILTAGNVAGVSTVEADIQVPPGTPDPKFLQIKTSTTLDEVADKIPEDFTGDELLAANEPLVTSKDDIYPGLTIRLPTEPAKND
ncbi:BON domain-containing protein [Gluconobacter wancherniae]|uniref:BON domain-containing protein n=1 Tax=Gluconobacter wancherniae NBRC 103581 TaxID=656744 RepID=A0A511AZC0_9PROT|nr:BON domain-containing protein [Gluconobacter wancherniae]MBF0852839.1 BON domain-containing protein [Gluconobacter wancherniae]MBS1061816.1 BON domain-containing protein [Gluconobacter wancherniae]MBS1087726.1 BON domain-containing protein [Gluconobacter wancherniae]MBS1093408.1 BON domain-containing protein [Gluconobacter wancherniae]GBD56446.1 peptidoglycan-binding protein LysM [Gluconobacter wancherniae NBRC 103581]